MKDISTELFDGLNLKVGLVKATEIVASLFFELEHNNYLRKVCAILTFAEKVNLDYLENHLNNIHRNVYLDTQILIHALCYSYEITHDFNDFYFMETKHFLKNAYSQNVSLYTTNLYFKELKYQFFDAINLIPFTKLEFFNKLGSSKNAFYRFYKDLVESDIIDTSFEGYLSEIAPIDLAKDREIADSIRFALKSVNIDVYDYKKHFHIEVTKNIIYEVLMEEEKTKSGFALSNDSVAFEFLSQNDTDVHPTDPIFITWDNILFKSRKKYYEKNKNKNRWFMFTPTQFVDHYTITKFDFNENTITNEMIAVLENRFAHDTYYLIDSINDILNINNEVGLKYAKRFAEIRDEQIYKNEFFPITEDATDNVVAIDFVIREINNKYRIDHEIFSKYKAIFDNEDNFDVITEIIEKATTSFRISKKVELDIFTEIDKVIKNNPA